MQKHLKYRKGEYRMTRYYYYWSLITPKSNRNIKKHSKQRTMNTTGKLSAMKYLRVGYIAKPAKQTRQHI